MSTALIFGAALALASSFAAGQGAAVLTPEQRKLLREHGSWWLSDE